MTDSAWPRPPDVPRLAPGAVDVWRVDLDAPAPAGRALLSSPERERAERFVRAQDGERWAAARGAVRALLGATTGADPRALQFAQGAHGKPELAGEERVRFNLAHSGGVALIALALDREVGIDVELPRRNVDHVAIARRVLAADEADRIATLADPGERERAFLRAWVRWEATLKCWGTGIAGAERGPRPAQPWIADLALAAPGAAALAVAAGPVALRHWSWPPAAR